MEVAEYTRIDPIEQSASTISIPEVSRRQVLQRFGSNVVKIMTGQDSGGTGFVLETSRGRPIIVTAGHVVRDHAISSVSVQKLDEQGVVEYGVQGGCVMDSMTGPDELANDIALLALDDEATIVSRLELGSSDTATTMVNINYQVHQPASSDEKAGQHDVRDPQVQSVKPVASNGLVTTVLSGFDAQGEPVLPGASGSPVLTPEGKVAGMFVAYSPYPIDKKAQSEYGVKGKSWQGWMVDADRIASVLAAEGL